VELLGWCVRAAGVEVDVVQSHRIRSGSEHHHAVEMLCCTPDAQAPDGASTDKTAAATLSLDGSDIRELDLLALDGLKKLLATGDDAELRDDEDVGIELKHLLGHIVVEAGDHRDDGNDRGDADDDAQQREKAPHLVASQRLACYR
jgi:hypothetical protein